jgi:hypothetical protein
MAAFPSNSLKSAVLNETPKDGETKIGIPSKPIIEGLSEDGTEFTSKNYYYEENPDHLQTLVENCEPILDELSELIKSFN